ncbi:MAG TPA: hypothetical protein PL117_08045 [Accumulibacter sp.]|uniref:hypothetical protein n=1 Tax=Accumulibacter sp. TaxID=2053492 RepID=UPI000EC5BCF6|nr:hypothetical protein [Accumulibacter sp.]HCZ17432.1 hypothetical protein [Accumulibacter sp.]HRD91923.1 hypothetical protein [Accumulibacter sp.]HRF72708.1 hypothetical protein [Accumulibacter sp.]
MKRSYWVIVAVVFLVGLDWFIRAPDSRSRQLTDVIETQGSAKLKSYPYQFRVMKVDGKTAFISTPRNVEVPAFKALAVLYPEIDTMNANDPAFIAVQTLLGEVQAEARSIVLSQPGIDDVRWELDREWLAAHYIDVPQE